MKGRPKTGRANPRRANRRGAGAATGARKPTPGWKGWSTVLRRGWRNPRPPAVPATLELSLADYFTAASLIGLLSSQSEEPDQKWCRDWSIEMGDKVAVAAQKRRRRRRRAA